MLNNYKIFAINLNNYEDQAVKIIRISSNYWIDFKRTCIFYSSCIYYFLIDEVYK